MCVNFLNVKIPILCMLCHFLLHAALRMFQTAFGKSNRHHPVVLLLVLDHDSLHYSPDSVSSALDLSERPAGINTRSKNVKSFHFVMFSLHSAQESCMTGSHIG